MKKYKIIIIPIIFLSFASTSGFIYGKKVQAAKLEKDLHSALQNGDYNSAALINKKVSDDIIISKLYNLEDKSKILVHKQYELVKNDYINDVISYDILLQKIIQLETSNNIQVADSEKVELRKIEALREKYRYAERLLEDEKFSETINLLKEIDSNLDNVYKEKVNKLRINISDKAVAETVSNLSSKTKFLVWVDIPNQTTNIFMGSKADWKLIRSFTSSTGEVGEETPTGTYTIKDRGKWFFSEKYQQGGRYWVRFLDNYLFHSLPMNENRQVVDPTLGTPASHGCVRLSVEDAAWFYNNIPNGSTVYIK